MSPQAITPKAPPRERDLFIRALEMDDPEQRRAFIESACDGNPALRDRVLALLEEESELGEFLETPALAADAHGESDRTQPLGSDADRARAQGMEKIGDFIGPYKLLQKIGDGGCGTVYMAEQDRPVRRRVAVKVIKPGMDTRNVIARFEAERQALAMMEHPNIAKVLEAGATDKGRPYFVMELVRGILITKYCDQNHLTVPERLHLFVQVAQAIQHAHQKGVIHRDIKPSNILVTLHDGVPAPKVIDFGIAKATEQRLTDKTLFTQFQSFIGTPAYMSPEQAEMSGLDIDTRSDVYALGVLLYELLTGQPPFTAEALLRNGVDECRRTLREKEPSRPSLQVRTMLDADQTSTAKLRQTEPARLASLLNGDLDWIVMKCLEKDRTRRYDTVNGLIQDIHRYLANEPVMARPPSVSYRIRKFVRRNRAMVAAAGAAAVILVTGVCVSTWQAFRATRAEEQQRVLREKAEAAESNEAAQRRRAEEERLAALRRAYDSDMNLAQQALAANNYGRLMNLLDSQRPQAGMPDLRQWEWRYYWNQARSDAAFAFPNQGRGIEGLALAPNARLMASMTGDGTLKLWNWSSQSQVAVLSEDARGWAGDSMTFSKDGSLLAAVVDGGRRDGVVRIWSAASRQEKATFEHGAEIEALQFSPDGASLWSFTEDGNIWIWDLASGASKVLSLELAPVQERRDRRSGVFSAGLKRLAVWDRVNGVQIYNAQTGAEQARFMAFERGVQDVVFSPDEKRLAVSPKFTETQTSIKIYDAASGQLQGQLRGHVSWIPELAFSADGTRLVSAGADQTLRVWDAVNLKPLSVLRGHRSEIKSVAVGADSGLIVSGSKNGSLFGWEMGMANEGVPYKILPAEVRQIAFVPGRNEMLATHEGGSVRLWDLEKFQEMETLDILGRDNTSLVFSPDGSRLFAANRDESLQVLDWATRLIVTRLRGFDRDVTPLGLTHGGDTLVTISERMRVQLWNVSSWELETEWQVEGEPKFRRRDPTLLPRKGLLALQTADDRLGLRDIKTGEEVATFPIQTERFSEIGVAPEEDLLATAAHDGALTLYDLDERRGEEVLMGHLLGIHAVAFSPDGKRLASGSHGKEAVKIWDVTTRHEVATLAGEGSVFHYVRFSPNGEWLAAINFEGQAHLWHAPPLEKIDRAASL